MSESRRSFIRKYGALFTALSILAVFLIATSINSCGKVVPTTLSHDFAYVAGQDKVSAYSINSTTGSLEFVQSLVVTGSNREAMIDPTGKFLYVTNITGNFITAFRIDPTTGTLTTITGPFTTDTGPQMMAIDPQGKYLYCTDLAAGNISAFSINASTGALNHLTGSPFDAGGLLNQPFGICTDQTGNFLYVTNVGDGTGTYGFRIITGTGTLELLNGSPFGPLHKAWPLSIGGYIYETESFANVVHTFSVNEQTGDLTEVNLPAPPTETGPVFLATDSQHRFLFVTNNETDNISVYTIEASDGSLHQISDSPFAVGTMPRQISVDPSDKYLYIANSSSGDISVEAINAGTGALYPAFGYVHSAATQAIATVRETY